MAILLVGTALACGRSFDRRDVGDVPRGDQAAMVLVDQGPRCAIANGGCAPTATCSEESGAVVCTCPEGTIGDGRRCDPGARIALESQRLGEWFFGQPFALSGDGRTLVAAVTAERSPSTGVNAVPSEGTDPSGAVYVFRRGPDGWTRDAFIKAFNADEGDRFGTSVAISNDGATLAVGADQEEGTGRGVGADDNNDGRREGAVYVYGRDEDGWALEAYVKAETDEVTGTFGQALALSGDGSTLVVQSTSFFGPAFVSTYERRDGDWSFLDVTDSRGPALRLRLNRDATTLIASTPRSRGVDGDVGGLIDPRIPVPEAGTIVLLERDGDSWRPATRFNGPVPEEGDRLFGTALSDDGTVLVAGANGEDGSQGGIDPPHDNELADSGAAYVFRRSGERWTVATTLKASVPAFRMSMGAAAVSGDGRLIAVGAPRESSAGGGIRTEPTGRLDGSGAVFLFRFDGAAWTQTAIVKAPIPEPDARFGSSVALSRDGSLLLVSPWLENSGFGALYAYELEDDR